MVLRAQTEIREGDEITIQVFLLLRSIKIKLLHRKSVIPMHHSIENVINEIRLLPFQYLSFMYGQCRRKRTIPSYWFFECRCERRGSTDDLGSFLSAIWCPKCLEEGALSRNPLLPVDPYNAVGGNWKCLECNAEYDL